jgi:hypothetical protein
MVQGLNLVGARFLHLSILALGPTQPPMQWALDNSWVRLRHGIDRPPPSSIEVQESVELHLYSPLGLHGLLQGELYHYIYFNQICIFSKDSLALHYGRT